MASWNKAYSISIFLLGSVVGYSVYFYKQASPLHFGSHVTVKVFVPVEHADNVRDAMGKAGAGKMGNYDYCSFSYKGIGRYVANTQAHPERGKVGVLEAIEEECIQALCAIDKLQQVIAAIKKVHPYEEPGIDIVPLLSSRGLNRDLIR